MLIRPLRGSLLAEEFILHMLCIKTGFLIAVGAKIMNLSQDISKRL